MFDMVPFRRKNLTHRGDLFNEMLTNFFDDDFFTPMNLMEGSFKVDLKETENDYVIEADLPGMKKDSIDIDYDHNYLTISAKRDDIVEDNNDNYVRRERHYGEFKRSFRIDNVDENSIDASFSDGVLRVILPKQNKGKQSKRRIDIH